MSMGPPSAVTEAARGAAGRGLEGGGWGNYRPTEDSHGGAPRDESSTTAGRPPRAPPAFSLVPDKDNCSQSGRWGKSQTGAKTPGVFMSTCSKI